MVMNVETEAKPMIELTSHIRSAYHIASALRVKHEERCSGCGFDATLRMTLLFLAGARGLIENENDALALVREVIRNGECLEELDAIISYLKEIKADGEDYARTEEGKRNMETIDAAFREVRSGGSRN